MSDTTSFIWESIEMLFALAASLVTISTEDLRREFPIDPVDAVIVENATARFVEHSRAAAETAMKDVIPIVIRFPDKRCVVFWIRVPYLGNGPQMYCYDDSDKFVEAFETWEE